MRRGLLRSASRRRVRFAGLIAAVAAVAAVGVPQGALALPGDIHTIAGGSIGNGYSLFGTIKSGSDVAYNTAGDKLYIADRGDHRVRVVSEPFSQLSTVAGTGSNTGLLGDGGPATSARLNSPDGVAVDAAGNVYIADTGNHRIRKVSPLGIITTVAGNGLNGFAGDGGPATAAQLSRPRGVAVDANGDIYIADTGNSRIRRVVGGTIETVAGAPLVDGLHTSAEAGPAMTAGIPDPVEVALAPRDNPGPDGIPNTADDFAGYYILEARNPFNLGFEIGKLWFVDEDGFISRYAGCIGQFLCPRNDGGFATMASLVRPLDISVDAAGAVYIADAGDNRIRKVSTAGTISTVAGNGRGESAAGDTGPARKAFIDSPEAVSVHPDLGQATFSIADTGNFKIRRVRFGDIGPTIGAFGDSGRAINAWITKPRALATDSTGLMYVVDSIGRLRKVKSPHSLAYIITLVGDEPMLGYEDAFFADPQDVTVDTADQVFFTDLNGDRVFRLGTGTGLGAVELITDEIAAPGAIAAGKNGFLTVAESTNPLNNRQVLYVASGHNVFAVSKGKAPVRLAGSGACGNGGDGGPSSAATLCSVTGLATDAAGNLFIASDTRVRKITFGPDKIMNGSDDVISTVAGPFVGISIRDVSVGPGGTLYLARSNHTVFFTGTASVVAGTATAGFSGDGGPATAADLNGPLSVDYDAASGRVYIADTNNNRVRYIEP